LLGDLNRHLGEETLEIEQILRREQYVRRLLFAEGTDPRVEAAWRSVRARRAGRDSVYTDEELFVPKRIILVGGTGSGKSFVLKRAYVGAVRRFGAEQPAPFFLDLDANLGTRLDVVEALESKYEGMFSRALAEHKPGCYLMLDSLDDRVLRSGSRFVNDLKQFLHKLGRHTAGCIIACRRAAFDPDWFRNSRLGLETFHVDHLSHEEFRQILPDDAQRMAFFVECNRLGISELLSMPFDGFYLARRFAAGKALPTTRRDCLNGRIDEMLLGTPEDRKTGSEPPPARLRAIARHLACLATFTEGGSWTRQDVVDHLSESVAILGSEPIKPEGVRALFERPMFVRAGPRFTFVHQLYREILAAEALRSLPARKQRLLLATALPGSPRICTPYRGVAAFLAEVSPGFGDQLIEDDPLVALFAESPSLRPEQEEQLLTRIFELAVRDQRYPWWMVPPRGEQPLNELSRHRPGDPSRFLGKYLTASDATARMWACACAARWGGVRDLNDILVRLALDPMEHEETRKWAMQAVDTSGDRTAAASLYPLTADPRDSVRGDALALFRRRERPSPSEYLRRLRGGATQENLVCSLQSEAQQFGLEVPREELGEAFSRAHEEIDRLKDLAGPVLSGLFERAADIGFTDVPADLIVRCLGGELHSVGFSEGPLELLIREHAAVIERVWGYCLDRLRQGDELPGRRVSIRLAELAGDRLLPYIQIATAASAAERRFVEATLRWLYYNCGERTTSRLSAFRAAAPAIVDDSWHPVPITLPAPFDPQAAERAVLEALATGREPVERAWRLLISLRDLGPKEGNASTLDKVEYAIAQLTESTRQRVLDVFRECTATLTFELKVEGRNITCTKDIFAIPFWVLYRKGEVFSTSKIAEFAACYAYSISQIDEIASWDSLLRDLRDRDVVTWRQCLLKLIEHGSEQARNALRLLGAEGSPAFTGPSRRQMRSGQLPPVWFEDLVDYWLRIRPDDCMSVLHDCYRSLRDQEGNAASGGGADNADARSYRLGLIGPHPWLVALLALMAEGHEPAWRDFEGHLREGTLPRLFNFERLNPLAPTLSGRRLTAIADWLIGECRGGGDIESVDGLARSLLLLIIESGEIAAIEELRRVREAVGGAKQATFGAAILQVEDRAIGQAPKSPPAGELLDFVNLPQYGMVRDERDLAEAVCQAVDDIQVELERRGEGVAGFWNGSEPKTEPDCQNVLWPRLRDKLFHLGVIGVEERYVGPNRVDFWIELARPGRELLSVAIELKTARRGSGRAWLVDTIEKQLYQQYLRPTGCRHGVHIVLWFRDKNRYDAPSRWKTANALRNEVRRRCNRLEREHGISIAGYVLDLTAPHRDR